MFALNRIYSVKNSSAPLEVFATLTTDPLNPHLGASRSVAGLSVFSVPTQRFDSTGPAPVASKSPDVEPLVEDVVTELSASETGADLPHV